MQQVKYFNGADQLSRVTGYPNGQFLAAGGVKSASNYYDGYNRMMGVTSDGRLVPVERKISYKVFSSRHECNSKCLNGKHNGACECQCGGKNHGRGMFTNMLEAA